jgi:hypothetical protein
MSGGGSLIKSVKQNLAQLNSRKKHNFKSHFSKGIFSKEKKDELNFTKVSEEELILIKEKIRKKAQKRQRKLLILTIIFTTISLIGIYYFFEIATR